MVYNLDCYFIPEYYFSPHFPKQNIYVNSETSFFAWFQVPKLHKSESGEPPPKVSQKSICGLPSKAAICSCFFIEKEQKGKRMHQEKMLQRAPGWAAHSLSFPAASLISLCLWSSLLFSLLILWELWLLWEGVGRKQPQKLCCLGMLWTSIRFV